MSVLAIIPARGGSKRIPGKNIKPFMGKPLIAYAIEAALQSGIFDEVMVSTDSEEIAAIARQYGANVPFMRSAETATDKAPTAAVLAEVIRKYKEELGMDFDYYACIYSNPFVRAEILRDAYQKFKDSKAHVVTPVVEYSYPPQRGFHIVDGNLKFVQPEHIHTRTQDLPRMYHDVGMFYFYNKDVMTRYVPLDEKYTMPYILHESENQDMDSPEDWKMAEIKYRLLHENV